MENQSDKWIIYPETKVVCFHNPEEENGFLSNWYVSRFEVDGKMFSSMEQFMMYQKASCFHDEAVAEKILKLTMLHVLRNWDVWCLDIMKIFGMGCGN